jgi:hypothetical protein
MLLCILICGGKLWLIYFAFECFFKKSLKKICSSFFWVFFLFEFEFSLKIINNETQNEQNYCIDLWRLMFDVDVKMYELF